jgi:excisionase family DNA binding protein
MIAAYKGKINMPEYVPLTELAARVGRSKVTLLRWIWAKRLAAVRIGSQWAVSRREADRLERELQGRPAGNAVPV